MLNGQSKKGPMGPGAFEASSTDRGSPQTPPQAGSTAFAPGPTTSGPCLFRKGQLLPRRPLRTFLVLSRNWIPLVTQLIPEVNSSLGEGQTRGQQKFNVCLRRQEMLPS